MIKQVVFYSMLSYFIRYHDKTMLDYGIFYTMVYYFIINHDKTRHGHASLCLDRTSARGRLELRSRRMSDPPLGGEDETKKPLPVFL